MPRFLKAGTQRPEVSRATNAERQATRPRPPRPPPPPCYSRVRWLTSARMSGAASNTTGNIASQEINQDISQCSMNLAAPESG